MTEGKHTASCGHAVDDLESLVDTLTAGEDCDAMDGFHPCVVYSTDCPACASKAEKEGLLFASYEDAESWLDAASDANHKWKEASPGEDKERAMKAYHAVYELAGARWSSGERP